ncbi:GNAT family N-acetyltransferase [Xanthomonas maliensis]|uniref:GNAT family N-acetyltransferase n=1 Tax=Xanthomonas maliensis TaxID=1321368 RepID=UPI0003A9313E|nr:GNAT family N-acetyltransferase [Xanthomonas maliensis]KAB7769047.1 N-acetyltransferase [Xanthomonas maliensis]
MQMPRPYTTTDFAACLDLFDGNVPTFFSREERPAFVTFLREAASGWNYHVIERNAQVVAAGGYALSDDGRCASFCWGMVAPALQRQGLGTALVQARLRAARRTPGVSQVLLDTSQRTCAFYARFGFVVQVVTANGYGPGLDRYDMVLRLD